MCHIFRILFTNVQPFTVCFQGALKFNISVTPIISDYPHVRASLYLGVEWRRQISELCDVWQQRSLLISVHIRPITALQTVTPLCLWYCQIAVTRRSCGGEKHFVRSLNMRTDKKCLGLGCTNPQVSLAGPASSMCCSCCWYWRCGWRRHSGVWSLSPGATRQTSSSRPERPRTPVIEAEFKNATIWNVRVTKEKSPQKEAAAAKRSKYASYTLSIKWNIYLSQ